MNIRVNKLVVRLCSSELMKWYAMELAHVHKWELESEGIIVYMNELSEWYSDWRRVGVQDDGTTTWKHFSYH